MCAKAVELNRTNAATLDRAGVSGKTTRRFKRVSELLLKPSAHDMIPLGTYDAQHPPKVMVELEQDSNASDSIVTVITRMTTAGNDSMFLHITNHGAKPVTAGVWRL